MPDPRPRSGREADALAIAPCFACSGPWIAGDPRSYRPGSPAIAAQVKAGGVDKLLQMCDRDIDAAVRDRISANEAVADRYGLALVANEAAWTSYLQVSTNSGRSPRSATATFTWKP
ncbi:hypothetical protein [Couchioplanes caeruleus]|uniref:Uncharacterized protein n=2 Tax=Couchioplanes caeruleus TaxID=56438 RepID=A0A1K0FCI5_9ACTN|nr:hypothetical protein [Couchioplanes caeruleus]OJF10559.1 hypothetical protein BG844_31600 [Couchioplanes caeruleus subsp. caeruleus]